MSGKLGPVVVPGTHTQDDSAAHDNEHLPESARLDGPLGGVLGVLH